MHCTEINKEDEGQETGKVSDNKMKYEHTLKLGIITDDKSIKEAS